MKTPLNAMLGRLFACALLVIGAAPGWLQAQEASEARAPASDTAVTAPAHPLAPFVGVYAVYNDGKPLGEATMRLARSGAHWRVDLEIRGTRGLLRLAGLKMEQSTLFDAVDGQFRPLSQSRLRKAVFRSSQRSGVYDWASGTARWSGDIKPHRRGPVALQPGDLSGLLINLAVIRDARPGQELHYRYVDDGRAREHHYRVSAEAESISVGDLDYNALRVDRLDQGDEQTTIWIADGVPTPIRMLRRDDGDAFDLRLIQYTGA